MGTEDTLADPERVGVEIRVQGVAVGAKGGEPNKANHPRIHVKSYRARIEKEVSTKWDLLRRQQQGDTAT